jgi:hypothetical protein
MRCRRKAKANSGSMLRLMPALMLIVPVGAIDVPVALRNDFPVCAKGAVAPVGKNTTATACERSRAREVPPVKEPARSSTGMTDGA